MAPQVHISQLHLPERHSRPAVHSAPFGCLARQAPRLRPTPQYWFVAQSLSLSQMQVPVEPEQPSLVVQAALTHSWAKRQVSPICLELGA